MTFSYDQIPLIRLSAKKAYIDGRITAEKYNELLSIIDELQQRKRIDDYRIQESIRSSLFKQTLTLT